MATMASKLARAATLASAAMRASRAAALASARAARSAAAARRAAAAVSRATRSSTDAAVADLALDSSREARSFRCDASMNRRLQGDAGGAGPPVRIDSSHFHSYLFPDDKSQPEPEFVANEKDLESDEALWDLYERWCKHFNQERDHDEMARRFNEFKRVVLRVHQANNSDYPNKLAINQFTDGKLAELCLGGYNASKQVEFAAKLPKSGVSYIWLDGKYYMELPKECQPE